MEKLGKFYNFIKKLGKFGPVREKSGKFRSENILKISDKVYNKCESLLNLRYTSNILAQFSYLKVVLASFCKHLKKYRFIFYDMWGKKSGEKVKKYWKSQEISEEEKSGNPEPVTAPPPLKAMEPVVGSIMGWRWDTPLPEQTHTCKNIMTTKEANERNSMLCPKWSCLHTRSV